MILSKKDPSIIVEGNNSVSSTLDGILGRGIRGEIIVLARRLELKHDATEVEITSTVRFF